MRRVSVVIVVSLVVLGCATGTGSNIRGGDGGRDVMDGAPRQDAAMPVPADGGGAAADGAAADGAAVDGAAADAGTSDAGGVDAGRGDAGRVDGGACGTGLTRCGAACVDTRTSLAHCGACDRACDVAFGTEMCVAGGCFIGTCETGRADCNMSPTDGCEGSCSAGGACATSCGTTGTRSCASVCAPSCTPPSESCNARDDDCNGSCESGLAGCRSPVHRSVRGNEHFYTLSSSEAACCGFSVETLEYFFVYTSDTPGLVPLHRCLLSTGTRFYTRSSTCEGAGGATLEGILGWVANDATCGATPLFRLWKADSGHFYTTDAGERDAAVASIGFTYEGIEGYVWRAR